MIDNYGQSEKKKKKEAVKKSSVMELVELKLNKGSGDQEPASTHRGLGDMIFSYLHPNTAFKITFPLSLEMAGSKLCLLYSC